MRTYFFEKTPGPGIFHFQEVPRPKPKTLEIQHFLVTLGNSTLLDIPYAISLITLGNFKSLSGIAHYKLVTLAINKAGRY